MDELSRRDVIKRGAAVGIGAVALPGLAGLTGCDDDSGTGTKTSPPANLTGRVVRPGDPDYEKARRDWDGLYSSFPLAIAFCGGTDDAVNALTWSRQNDVAIRARAGRHNLEGWSNVTGGLVIDVSEMKDVQIDAAAKTATVGAGLTQAEVVKALGAKGLTVPTGSEGDVGQAGATLGGGFGFLTRAMGMACDNLTGVEIVIPDGSDGAKAVKADESINSDLLFACRGGGGGNFGIVTSFTFKLHQIGDCGFLTASWPDFESLHEVFDSWQHQAPTADQRLTSVLDIGKGTFRLVGVLANGTKAEISQLMNSQISIGKAEVTVDQMSYPDIFDGLNSPGPLGRIQNWKFFSQFATKPYPAQAIDVVAKFMNKAPTEFSDFFCNSFGGAVNDEPSGGTAFPHREALFYSEPGAGWNGDKITQYAQSWVAEFAQELRPYVDGAYVNVPNAGMADWETAYYGDNYSRLQDIKAKYDPDEVFQFEQSIRPA
jgi:hypothetical protein